MRREIQHWTARGTVFVDVAIDHCGKSGKLVLVVGSIGGSTIIISVARTLIAVLDSL